MRTYSSLHKCIELFGAILQLNKSCLHELCSWHDLKPYCRMWHTKYDSYSFEWSLNCRYDRYRYTYFMCLSNITTAIHLQTNIKSHSVAWSGSKHLYVRNDRWHPIEFGESYLKWLDYDGGSPHLNPNKPNNNDCCNPCVQHDARHPLIQVSIVGCCWIKLFWAFVCW